MEVMKCLLDKHSMYAKYFYLCNAALQSVMYNPRHTIFTPSSEHVN